MLYKTGSAQEAESGKSKPVTPRKLLMLTVKSGAFDTPHTTRRSNREDWAGGKGKVFCAPEARNTESTLPSPAQAPNPGLLWR